MTVAWVGTRNENDVGAYWRSDPRAKEMPLNVMVLLEGLRWNVKEALTDVIEALAEGTIVALAREENRDGERDVTIEAAQWRSLRLQGDEDLSDRWVAQGTGVMYRHIAIPRSKIIATWPGRHLKVVPRHADPLGRRPGAPLGAGATDDEAPIAQILLLELEKTVKSRWAAATIVAAGLGDGSDRATSTHRSRLWRKVKDLPAPKKTDDATDTK